MQSYPFDRLLQGTELLILLGEYGLAAAGIDALAVVAPHTADLLGLRSALLQAQGQSEAAITWSRLALGRDPLLVSAWQRLANLLPDADERAVAAERAALLADPAVWDLWHGKPHLSVTRLDELATTYPDWPEWTILHGEALRRLNALAQASFLVAPLLERVPAPTPALWLFHALECMHQEANHTPLRHDNRTNLLRQAAAHDPAGASARRCFAPDRPPFRLPAVPEVLIPTSVKARLDELSEIVPADVSEPTEYTPLHEELQAKGGRRPIPWGTGIARELPRRIAKAFPFRDQPAAASPEAEALAEVERMTQKLFGTPPAPLGEGPTAALLVTHRRNLTLHASAGTNQIFALLDQFALALQKRGVAGKVVVVDDAENLASFGPVAPAVSSTPSAIAEVVRAVGTQLAEAGQRLDAILLVGGDKIIPFHRLANPTADMDKEVLSDNPYGSLGGSALLPDLVVARLPDGGDDEGSLLHTLLERSVAFHQGYGSAPAPSTFFPLLRRRRGTLPTGSPINGWAASALAWQLPSQTVYSTIGSPHPLVLCPPAIPPLATASWESQRVLYFNLHGIANGANWYGQVPHAAPGESLPLALTPDSVTSLYPNAICVSEACYGAEITGRTQHNSMALRILSNNALAFVGSTATAYGAVSLPIGGADVLIQQLLTYMRRGHPVGRALLLARDGLARSAVEGQGYLDPDEAKTLLSFVLLGDPWATPYARPVLQAKAVHQPLRPQLAHRQPLPLTLLPSQSIAAARRLLAKVAPCLAQLPLEADGQLEPQLAPKGGSQVSAVVLSAQASYSTVDGQHGSLLARVTLADDQVRKLLMSR